MNNKILEREFNKNKIIDDYDQLAGYYDLWSKLTETRAINKAIELAEIHNHEHVLEVAVGTGVAFKKIIHLNPDGMNTGIDLSSKMLKSVRKKLKDISENNYQVKTGNAYDLQFEDQSFDVLINNFMLDLLPENDFEIILNEFYRVLKPGGRIVISTFSFGTNKIQEVWHWIALKFPEILKGCRPISLEKYIENSGFRIKQMEHVSQNTFPSLIIKAVKPG